MKKKKIVVFKKPNVGISTFLPMEKRMFWLEITAKITPVKEICEGTQQNHVGSNMDLWLLPDGVGCKALESD